MDEKLQPAHEQYAEDLALYALGALQADSCAQLEQHLKACPACRRELETMRGDAAVLALSVAGPTPPARARERLLSAVGSSHPTQTDVVSRFAMRRPWWSYAPVFASLVLAVIALLLVRENTNLTKINEDLGRQVGLAEKQGRRAREIVGLMTAKDTMHVALVSTGNQPPPHAHTMYQPRTGRLCMMASNLKPLPAGMTYELWLIPKSGAPMPVGMFKPDAQGTAMVMPEKPVLAGTEARSFAVTMEPEGGSLAPTSPILLEGSGA